MLAIDDFCARRIRRFDQNDRSEEVRLVAAAIHCFHKILEQLAGLLDLPCIRPLILRNMEVVVATKDLVQRHFTRLELLHGVHHAAFTPDSMMQPPKAT